VVLLRKSIPQNHNLKTAAKLGVTVSKILKASASGASQKQKLYVLKNACFWFYASASLVFLAS
jgi:hypothetical protein